MPAQFHDVFCTSADGLRLHAREIGPATPSAGALPVLCLPGLTRTTADFEVLGRALAEDTKAPRRVVAIDYRGRGLSDYDPDPTRYATPVEMGDVLAVAAHLGIGKAIVIGTSRGGLISMVMAAAQTPLLAAVVLNDIGPAIEMSGLLKIKGYVGARPTPTSWDDAAHAIKTLFARDFPNLDEAGWQAWARRSWRETDGRFEQTYDPGLAQTLADFNPDTPLPELWEAFDTMKDLPMMLIHGSRSDLLSRATVEKMAARHPGLELVTVADQGHAPLLADAPTIARIAAFCAHCDSAA